MPETSKLLQLTICKEKKISKEYIESRLLQSNIDIATTNEIEQTSQISIQYKTKNKIQIFGSIINGVKIVELWCKLQRLFSNRLCNETFKMFWLNCRSDFYQFFKEIIYNSQSLSDIKLSLQKATKTFKNVILYDYEL